MADWQDVRRIVGVLPGVVEGTARDGAARWRVRRRLFAWQRRPSAGAGPLLAAEPLLAARVADHGFRERLVVGKPWVYVDGPPVRGRPVVLVRLTLADAAELAELLVDAWLHRAPGRLTAQYRRGSW